MVIDWTIARKNDIIFNTAREAVEKLTKKFEAEKDMTVDQNVWKDVVEGKSRSPKVMGIGAESDEKYMMYLPKYSAEFILAAEGHDTILEVIEGSFLNKKTGKKYNQGDRFLLSKNESIIPVTLSCEAYLKIEKI